LQNGICCSRIKYHQFPAEKGIKSILIATAHNVKKGDPKIKFNNASQCSSNCQKSPITSVSKTKKEIQKSKHTPVEDANYCIDLYVPDEARWRVCSGSEDKISKLHMKIVFNVVSSKLKGRAGLISNVLQNSRIGREVPVARWSWENQEKWKGSCSANFMQSPINILPKQVVKAKGVNFSISHHLLPVHTLIKRNEKEAIVAFMNFGGVFQILIDNTYLMFTPVYMSFRFPGEHLIDGDRKLGEILIHFTELSKQRKTMTSNGLILSIPLEPTADGLEIDSFEQLNVDFWKYEIQKHGTYTPKKFLKKKLLPFDLSSIMKKVSDLKPDYYFYYGSHTTPPCAENTYHLVINKPLQIAGCQFKLLRDNSLFSSRAKEIHARMEKPLGDRTVYTLSSAQVSYIRNISGIYPQSFNKYLLVHGYKYKAKLWAKMGKKYGKFGRYFRGENPWKRLFKNGPNDEWVDELNCDIPKN
jgi:carbonic anhydrase